MANSKQMTLGSLDKTFSKTQGQLIANDQAERRREACEAASMA